MPAQRHYIVLIAWAAQREPAPYPPTRWAGRGAKRLPSVTNSLFVARMDMEPEKEDLFTEGDDTEYVPTLLKAPGVHAVTRLEGNPFAVSIGGAAQHVAHTGPRSSGAPSQSTWLAGSRQSARF